MHTSSPALSLPLSLSSFLQAWVRWASDKVLCQVQPTSNKIRRTDQASPSRAINCSSGDRQSSSSVGTTRSTATSPSASDSADSMARQLTQFSLRFLYKVVVGTQYDNGL